MRSLVIIMEKLLFLWEPHTHTLHFDGFFAVCHFCSELTMETNTNLLTPLMTIAFSSLRSLKEDPLEFKASYVFHGSSVVDDSSAAVELRNRMKPSSDRVLFWKIFGIYIKCLVAHIDIHTHSLTF